MAKLISRDKEGRESEKGVIFKDLKGKKQVQLSM